MALRDFVLTPDSDGLYTLTAPSYNEADRVKTRFITQFLSLLDQATSRGTIFLRSVKAGEARTNADLVGAALIGASQARTVESRYLADTLKTKGASLATIEVASPTTFNLSIQLTASNGTTTTTQVTVTT